MVKPSWGRSTRALHADPASAAGRRRVSRPGLGDLSRRALIMGLVIATLAANAGPAALLNTALAHGQGRGGAPSTGGTPNRFDPATLFAHPGQRALPPDARFAQATPGRTLPQGDLTHTVPPTMQPGELVLQAGQPAHFVGSDGRLTVDVPAGAVTAADEVAAGGSLRLQIRQLTVPSGSSAGGSGHISLGSYLLQLVDASGRPAAHGLRMAATLRLRYGDRESAVNVANAVAVVHTVASGIGTGNGHGLTVPTGPPASAIGPATAHPVHVDAANHTLSAAVTLASASSTASFDTDAPVATFGKPDPFNTDLSAGALTMSEPLDLPPGPGGLTPSVSLNYSSADVSEQHNPQAAAPWVGEGWNLSLGAISWAEHNVTASCAPSCASNWEGTWQLSDPFGTAGELIPPSTTVSTYYDDSPYYYCDTGQAGAYPCPVQWHTATESHAKIYSYIGGLTLPYPGGTLPAHPPCFRVFLPSGIMEEFGCTADSLQWYYVPANNQSDYIANWYLDLITDPHGNQVHLTYQQDLATYPGTSLKYPRDTQLATVEYDSPGCHDAQHACTGSAWAPQMRVNFVAGHSVARVTGNPSTGNSCNADTSLRCDDPQDFKSSGGLAAPEVQNTLVLNDAQVQVRGSGGASWNTLKDYQLSYEQSGPHWITDPVSGLQEGFAGTLDLTTIHVVGSDGSTALPDRSFGYTWLTEHYEDMVATATPTGNCGPAMSWNTQCYLWSRSLDGNSRYLSSASNGLGLAQTFSWAEGRNNTHGVNNGADPTDTLYCDGKEGQGYPCSVADDENWSHAVLTAQTGQVIPAGTTQALSSTTTYSYKLTRIGKQPCSDCVVGMYWGSQNDGDYLDFYNGKFQGYTQVTVSTPDGAVEVHKFYATDGWGVYDTGQITACYSLSPCHSAPWWSPGTALHGREYEVDHYDTDGTTLLGQTKSQYQVTCPPSGVSGTPPTAWGSWDGKLVSELDPSNPVAVCDIQTNQVDTYTYEGAPSSWAVPHQMVSYTYDSYGRETSATTTTNDGGATGSPTTLVTRTGYVQNDNVTAYPHSATGTYLIDVPAFTDVEPADGSHRYSCIYQAYDGQGYVLGQTSGLTQGELTISDDHTNCGAPPDFHTSGALRTTYAYDAYGNLVASDDPDANAGVSGHTGCTLAGGTTTYSACTAFDASYATLPTVTTNALGQATTTGYGAAGDPAGGFGLWPTSVADANGQTTTTTYDALGRITSTTLPGEASGLTTTATSYTVWCAGTAAQAPCAEVDSTQRLDSGTTVTARAFYDGWGHLVETRTPAPGGQDVVQYARYDAAGRRVFLSNRYFVPAYTGALGSAAFATPDASQPGTSTAYTNLRSTTAKDALSDATTTATSVACGQAGDSACYVLTTVTDPLAHQQTSAADALGRTAFSQTFTGNNASTYAAYATTKFTYDYLGDTTQILHPDGTSKTTYTYDDAGRNVGLSHPDRGSEAYTYDADGNLVQSVDARGTAGTVYAGYDGLDRQLWRNSTNSASGAYVTNNYDSTANGNKGIGHLTGETFTGGPSNQFSGSYSFSYDARGQQTESTLTIGGTSYPLQATYDDAGHVLTQTYPDGELVTTSYSAQGWLQGLATQQSGTTTTLLSSVSYSGAGGAAGMFTGASLGGGLYSYAAGYDALARPTDLKYSRTSDGATLFESQPTYDASGNVAGVTTTLPQGTDTQQFCYDEQNRLTWAGSVGTPSCTGTAISAGTLATAQYQQRFSYDNLGRLTSGTLGSYSYGDGAHLHAATSIGSGYTASYDAAGDMTCRAPISGATCASSSPTGAQLTYDNEGRLVGWQNAPGGAPTSSTADLYDGAGQRVEQQVTQNGATTTTLYIGTAEEVTLSSSGTTTTAYYYANGHCIAEAVNGIVSYLGTDSLGSATVALSATGTGALQASQLFAPYGASRYSSGTMPTSYGFTGQRVDAATGLDYYGARFYDPVAGQFASADTDEAGGLNRYAYVGGNPETQTDPTGHCPWCIAGAVIGAVVGFAVSYGVQVAGNVQKHGWSFSAFTQNINWWAVGGATLGGALIGGTLGFGVAYLTGDATAVAIAARGAAIAARGAAIAARGISSLNNVLKVLLIKQAEHPVVKFVESGVSAEVGYLVGCAPFHSCRGDLAVLAFLVGALFPFSLGKLKGPVGVSVGSATRGFLVNLLNYWRLLMPTAKTRPSVDYGGTSWQEVHARVTGWSITDWVDNLSATGKTVTGWDPTNVDEAWRHDAGGNLYP